MERKINRDVLEVMVNIEPLNESELSDKSKVTTFGEAMTASLNADLDETSHYRLDVHEDEGQFGVKLTRRVHGNDREIVLDPSFFKSPDYRSIANLAEKLNGMLEEGSTVARGEKDLEVVTFKQAMDWLLAESKRGLTIQRYKGLGEMNPDQLWETTCLLYTSDAADE